MDTVSITVADTPLLRFTLQRADDALVLGHRLSEWCGRAPMMEEEMALSNTALDLIGQATALYQYAATIEGAGRSEDAYAYLRNERDFGNLLLLERPNGDFADAIARQRQTLLVAVPHRKGEHPAQLLQAALQPVAQEQAQQHLGVGMPDKAFASGFEVFAQTREVVNFSIKNNPIST